MKVRAPELAIRDAREPELFLEMNDVADGTILRGAQRLATDLAIPAPLACLEQLRRAEKTADMVGAERRLVAGGHRCFSWGLFAFPLMTDGRAIVKRPPMMPARSRFVLRRPRVRYDERRDSEPYCLQDGGSMAAQTRQTKEDDMRSSLFVSRRAVVASVLAATVGLSTSGIAWAADPLKIGLILPLTGPFASTGRQIEAACRLYIARNGDIVAGRKVELIVKDDTGAPETTKRIAQDLIVQQKVNILAGFGLTPLALATASVATEAKVPMVVMAAATSVITTRP